MNLNLKLNLIFKTNTLVTGSLEEHKQADLKGKGSYMWDSTVQYEAYSQ